jgi:hypothetical protein
MSIQWIGNVIVNETDKTQARAVDASYSNTHISTGNITITLGSNVVTGDTNCNFLADLGSLFVLRQRNQANVFIGKIANVTSASSAVLTRPAVVSSSPIGMTSGTGTIKATAASNALVGSSTTFTTQIDSGTEIWANIDLGAGPVLTKIGTVASVNSNTSITLSAGATYSTPDNTIPAFEAFKYLNSTNFKFQIYNQAEINYDPSIYRYTDDPHRGNGFITISSSNSYIVGTETIFTKQLDIGYQLYGNTYTYNQKSESLLGVVKNVFSNTLAELTTVCEYDIATMPYRFFDSVTINKSNIFTDHSQITSGMLAWSRSGLIANVTQVQSYHPPVPDPVTGVLVNFPATVHSAASITSNLNPLDNLNNSPIALTHGTIQDFDFENGIVGSNKKKAIDSIQINSFVKKLAESSAVPDDAYKTHLISSLKQVYGNVQIAKTPGIRVSQVPEGFVPYGQVPVDVPYAPYIGPGANIVYVENTSLTSNLYPTVADVLSVYGNYPPPKRVIDNRDDANLYYDVADPASTLTEVQRADLAARAMNQFSTNDSKKVKTTGVPVAIPGLLNVTLVDENPANRKYTRPSYDPEFVGIDKVDNFNPDLPISPTNEPPAPL